MRPTFFPRHEVVGLLNSAHDRVRASLMHFHFLDPLHLAAVTVHHAIQIFLLIIIECINFSLLDGLIQKDAEFDGIYSTTTTLSNTEPSGTELFGTESPATFFYDFKS